MNPNGKWYDCPVCGKRFYRSPSQIKNSKILYCSTECFKTVNSPRMTKMNHDLNPTRMTETTKAKLRKARLKTPEDRKSYAKLNGQHEHRIVAEQILGRPLHHGEVVHHIDGNKQNNSPQNLMVFASQADHARWHAEHEKEVMPK